MIKEKKMPRNGVSNPEFGITGRGTLQLTYITIGLYHYAVVIFGTGVQPL
jgi:hypothetical protein